MESEPSSTPKLPLFSIAPEPPGMVAASPLHTSASVPFRWEEEPGKPRPCTTLITLPPNPNGPHNPKSLDLPPRLFMTTKMPSPTTVLDGPYLTAKQTSASSSSSSRFSSSSFRLSRVGQGQGQGWSFESASNKSPEKLGHEGKGLFGSWGKKSLKLKGCKEENVGGNFAFSSSTEVMGSGEDENENGKVERLRRNGSLSKPRSHFWAAIYEGIKKVIPWKSRKSKREGFII